MRYTLSQIATHNKQAGYNFFKPVMLDKRGDQLKDFKIIYHGGRVFLYAKRREKLISCRPYTVVEYERDTGRIVSISPGGIRFQSPTMIKKYISMLPESI